MSQTVKLTADLYDARDPNRPRVFLHPTGAVVPKELADRFGGQYAGAKAAPPKDPVVPQPPAKKVPAKKRTAPNKKIAPATKGA